MVEQSLKLGLAHSGKHLEGLQELDTTHEVTLDCLLNDAHVRLAVETCDLAWYETLVGHKVGFGVDQGSLSETFTRTQLT